jgi:hypothetical protein
MSVILISLLAFLFLTAIAVGVLLLVFLKSRSLPQSTVQNTPSPGTNNGPELKFRILDISLPLVVLALSIVCIIILYSRISTQVAYHFAGDGTGDQWLGRGLLITSLLLPQFLLTFLAAGIALTMEKVGRSFVKAGKAKASMVRDVISLMSNMIVLPQGILFFAMLDIFLYNAYQIHLIPLYLAAILIMFLGSIFMGFFFFRQIIRSRKPAS